MNLDNSLDLISDINTQISKLKKTTQRGGALAQLKNLKDADYKFLNKKEAFLLKKELSKIIDNGVTGKNNKLSYNIFNKIPKKQQGGKKQSPKTKKLSSIKKINDVTPSGHLSKELEKIVGNTKKISVKKIRDVTAAGHLSKELEKIVGGSKKYSVNADIQDILGAASYANLIDTEYIDNMVGGGKKKGDKSRIKKQKKGDKSWIKKQKKKAENKEPVETGVSVEELTAGFEGTDTTAKVIGRASNTNSALPPKIPEISKSLSSLTEISPIPIAEIADTLPKIPAPIAQADDINPVLSTVSATATGRLTKIDSHLITDDQKPASNSSLRGVLAKGDGDALGEAEVVSSSPAEAEDEVVAPVEEAAASAEEAEDDEVAPVAGTAVSAAEDDEAAPVAGTAVSATEEEDDKAAPVAGTAVSATEEEDDEAAVGTAVSAVRPELSIGRGDEDEEVEEESAVSAKEAEDDEAAPVAGTVVSAAEDDGIAPRSLGQRRAVEDGVGAVDEEAVVSAAEAEDEESVALVEEVAVSALEDEEVEEEVAAEVETAEGEAVKLSTRTASPPLIEPSRISLDMPATPERLLSMRSDISALSEHKDSDSFIEELCLKQTALEKDQSDATRRLDDHSYADSLVFNNKLTVFLYANSMRFLNTIDSKTDIGGGIKDTLKSDYMASMFDLLCILDPDWSEFDVNKFQRESANIEGSELMYYLFKNDDLLKLNEEGDGKDTLINILAYLTDSNTARLAENPNKQNIWVGQNQDGSGKILLKNLLNAYPCDK